MEETEWKSCLECVLESINEGVFISSSDGRVVYANLAAQQIFGRNRDELVSESIHKLLNVEELGIRDGSNQDEYSTGLHRYGRLARGIETVIDRPDGSRAIVSFTTTPLFSAEGQLIGTVTTFSDITQQREMGRELRESEARLSSLVESASDAIVGCTGAGETITLWNAAAEKLFGYTAEEAVGQPVRQIIPKRFWERHKSGVRRVTRLGRSKLIGRVQELEGTTKDGREVPIEFTYSSWKSGDQLSFFAIFRDIGERKKYEEALISERNRAQLYLDVAGAILVAVNRDHRVALVNWAGTKALGYPADEIVGSDWFEKFFPDDVRASTRAYFDRVMAGEIEGVEYYETPIMTKSGSRKLIAWHMTTLRDEGGRIVGALGSGEDISERRKAEQLSDSLDTINTTIHSTLDPDEIMRRVIVEASKVIGADSAVILRKQEERWHISHLIGLPEELANQWLTREQALVLTLSKTKSAFAVEDVLRDPKVREDVGSEIASVFNIRALLAVPLIVREESVGTLFFHFSSQHSFTDAELDFANKLGPSLSLALENSHLYESQRNIADTLQKSLLTLPDRVEGVRFAHLYRPGTEDIEVGGDFYDLFELERGRVGIVIGDVSGKGLPAATMTSLVKNSVKAYAHVEGSPASIIAKTNHLLLEAPSRPAFASVIVGILDIETGNFAYCCAGHPPAILRKSTSELFEFSTSSPVIGAFEDLRYSEGSFLLEPGDLLVFYTDGVTEARRGSDFFGEERLFSLVKPADSPQTVVYMVAKSINEFTGGKLGDDIAVITIMRGT